MFIDIEKYCINYAYLCPYCEWYLIVVTYEAMTPQCGRSVVQVLVVRVDIGVVIYEAMTPQCGRSVV